MIENYRNTISDNAVKFDGSPLELIQGADMEWKALNEVLFSITTGLNPRKNFKLNDSSDEELTSWYITTKDYSITEKIDFVEGKTAKITESARVLINNRSRLEKGDILLSAVGTVGKIALVDIETDNFDVNESTFVLKPNINEINTKFLVHILRGDNFQNEIRKNLRGSTLSGIRKETLEKIEIPIPSLEIQQKVVEILDKMTDYVTELTAELTAELTLRQKQYAYYRDKLLTFPSQSDSDESVSVKWMTLGEIGEVRMCKRILKSQTSSTGEVPFFKIGTFGKKPNAFISRALFEEYKEKYSYPKVGDLLISASGTIGRIVKFDGKDAYFQDSNIVWIDNDETQVRNDYLRYYYQIANWGTSQGGTITRLYNDGLKKMKIAVPPLELQYKIVEILDKFDKLTSNLTDGLPHEIELRQKQYEYWREQLLSFKKE